MAKFVLIYTGGSMAQTSEEQAAAMAAWGTWYDGMGSAVVDWGSPFEPMAKSIASDGSISDSPVGTPASGYSVITADSLDGAVAMAKECPIIKDGGQVAVYEAHEMG